MTSKSSKWIIVGAGLLVHCSHTFAENRISTIAETTPTRPSHVETLHLGFAPATDGSPSNSLDDTPTYSCECEAISDAARNDDAPFRFTGFFDLNYYWDTREFTVFTFNAGAKLPSDFEYFQFLNAFSPFGSSSTDWNAFYTEINLRRPIWKDSTLLAPFDWTAQLADGTFSQSVLRLGVRARIQDMPGRLGQLTKDVLKTQLAISFHVLETDGTGWQMEYAYRRDFWDKRIYIGGFLDHNIDQGITSTWVTENQIGLKLFDQWHAVAEYRYTTFAPDRFKSGWGFGIEYVIPFN
ncbi:MAG: hypothetical protein KDB27_16805 [Planctomycetales bacterium]|nr:hypothetical protein [Planctomycetales bacterium]